jgi:hypothetical protein
MKKEKLTDDEILALEPKLKLLGEAGMLDAFKRMVEVERQNALMQGVFDTTHSRDYYAGMVTVLEDVGRLPELILAEAEAIHERRAAEARVEKQKRALTKMPTGQEASVL